MASVIIATGAVLGTRIHKLDTVPGQWACLDTVLGLQRLPTEAIGSFVLTLTNLVVGSAVQIEEQIGTPIENRTAASSTEAFTVPAYAGGSASNDLRIKVRKGSGSPYYRPYETLAVAIVGSQSIFVSQIPDE